MNKLSFIFILLSIFIFSCSSTPLPSGRQTDIPEDFFGLVHAARTRTSEEYELLDEMGAKWVLSTFYWSDIERKKDTFDFSVYDPFVDDAISHGKKIIGVLGYAVSYLFPDGKSKKYITPENLHFYLRFVEETVRHFQGRVDVWSIWNEPNIIFWVGPDRDFYELTKQAALRIRETDPDVYITGGVFFRSPAGFIKRMYNAGAMEDLDGIVFHPYAVNPSGAMKVYDRFLKTLSEINYSRPVWVTEVGYPTGGWYPSKVSPNKFPSYIVKTVTGAAARGARALLWYETFDSVDPGKTTIDSESYFGLLNKDFSRKAGSWAFELCARFLPGSRYVPELPHRDNIPSHIVSFCFLNEVSDNNTLILWNDRKFNYKIELNLPVTALLHDISMGENRPLPVNASLDIGDEPLFITWQGTDIPLITKKQ
jgi:hypothetical protein